MRSCSFVMFRSRSMGGKYCRLRYDQILSWTTPCVCQTRGPQSCACRYSLSLVISSGARRSSLWHQLSRRLLCHWWTNQVHHRERQYVDSKSLGGTGLLWQDSAYLLQLLRTLLLHAHQQQVCWRILPVMASWCMSQFWWPKSESEVPRFQSQRLSGYRQGTGRRVNTLMGCRLRTLIFAIYQKSQPWRESQRSRHLPKSAQARSPSRCQRSESRCPSRLFASSCSSRFA